VCEKSGMKFVCPDIVLNVEVVWEVCVCENFHDFCVSRYGCLCVLIQVLVCANIDVNVRRCVHVKNFMKFVCPDIDLNVEAAQDVFVCSDLGVCVCQYTSECFVAGGAVQ